jgi:hypothetical protein
MKQSNQRSYVHGVTAADSKSGGVAKSRKAAEEPNEEEQVQAYNMYLAAGEGCGRLISAATVYDGKVGYFSVETITVDGVEQECIIFHCSPHDALFITAFPLQPKACFMSAAEQESLFQEARRNYSVVRPRHIPSLRDVTINSQWLREHMQSETAIPSPITSA